MAENRNYPGYFITLEGSEGGGKTTVTAKLREWFPSLNISPVTTREPGGTPIGDSIRDVLASLKNVDMHQYTEALLFQASRAQLTHQVIRPNLKAGKLVLCDRFTDSTNAYQGYLRRLGCGRVDALNRFSTGGLTPDLTLFLKLPVDVGIRRKHDCGVLERLDLLEVEAYEEVNYAFDAFVRFDQEDRWRVVDANRDLDSVLEDVKKQIIQGPGFKDFLLRSSGLATYW